MANATTEKLQRRVQDLSAISKGLQLALLQLPLSDGDREVFTRSKKTVKKELKEARLALEPLEQLEQALSEKPRKAVEKKNKRGIMRKLERVDQERKKQEAERIESSHRKSSFFKGVYEVSGGAPGSGKRS